MPVTVRRPATVTLLLVLLGGACGVPTQSAGSDIDPEKIPPEFLAPPPTEVRTISTTAPVGERFSVYLVREQRLVEVERIAPDLRVATRLRALLDGPSDAEQRTGLRSALPTGTDLAVSEAGGVVSVQLTPDITDLPSTDQLSAVAQIVVTLTEAPGVGQVAFTLNGARVSVPRGDGSTSTGIVSRDDYRSLLT